MVGQRREVQMPDLQLPFHDTRAGCWLTPPGAVVVEGDRILEIISGPMTVDVLAPATGRLVEQRVAEDEPLAPGQCLAVIEEDEPFAEP